MYTLIFLEKASYANLVSTIVPAFFRLRSISDCVSDRSSGKFLADDENFFRPSGQGTFLECLRSLTDSNSLTDVEPPFWFFRVFVKSFVSN